MILFFKAKGEAMAMALHECPYKATEKGKKKKIEKK